MLKNRRQKSFVLAEGMISIMLISSFFLYQSISLYQNINKLDQSKIELEKQRFVTNQEFKTWQEKIHSQ